MLQDEQREQDSLLAWFGDGLYDKPSPAPKKDAPHSCGLLAHVFLHVGETLIAISLYEFLLRFLPHCCEGWAVIITSFSSS